jgi:hypothetical protein
MKSEINVFDPPMCCSSGVCGASVNTGLDNKKEAAPVEKPNAMEFSDCNYAPSGAKLKIVASSVVLIAVLGLFGCKLTPAKTTEPAAVSNSNTPVIPAETMTSAKLAIETEPASSLEKLNVLSDLDTVAINQDAVLVFIPSPGNEEISEATQSTIKTAQATFKKNNIALGLYTLVKTSPDYPMLSAEAKPPAILVAAKGGGMLVIQADSTESEIVQAFMTVSGSGGCGPGGCGPTGCN